MGQGFKVGLLSSLLVLTLSACSDSDSDSEPGFQAPNLNTSMLALDGSNNLEATGVATESAVTTTESGNSAGGAMLKAGSDSMSLIDRVRQLLSQSSQVSSPALFSFSDTQNCAVSGSMSFSISIDDTSGTFTNMSISYSNCNEGTGETINGSMSVTANAGHSDTTMNVTASFNNFRVTVADATNAIHGSMIISEDGSGTSVISGTSFWMVEGSSGQSVHMQDFWLENVQDLSGNNTLNGHLTVDSSMLNGRITVTYTNVYTASGAMYPSSGTVVISGANATLTATILDANVDLSLDSNGDGTPDATSTVTWDQIATATSNHGGGDVNATGGV